VLASGAGPSVLAAGAGGVGVRVPSGVWGVEGPAPAFSPGTTRSNKERPGQPSLSTPSRRWCARSLIARNLLVVALLSGVREPSEGAVDNALHFCLGVAAGSGRRPTAAVGSLQSRLLPSHYRTRATVAASFKGEGADLRCGTRASPCPREKS
jgi:hypothetical protein